MVDTVRIIATAQRLIEENGRQVTFVQFNETPANTSQPWNGPADPRATPASQLVLSAAFVEPSSVVRLGMSTEVLDLFKRSEQVMIVSPGATQTLTQFQEVIDDDTSRWKIEGVQTLRPGRDILLNYVGVRR